MKLCNLKENYNEQMMVYFITDKNNEASMGTRIKDLDRRFNLVFLDNNIQNIRIKESNGTEYLVVKI